MKIAEFERGFRRVRGYAFISDVIATIENKQFDDIELKSAA